MRKLGKRGTTGQIGGLIGGIIGLVFMVVIGFVSLDILTDADLLTENSTFDVTTDALIGNLSAGVDKVSLKIPIMFTIAVAVLLLGLIVFLVIRARQAQQAQGGTI
jgi:cadmium resistance protein CadD (predicted permease)